ncbi:MAG TPA: GatB/YqeY domain-containing protein [Roseiarcus sp.]|nr:GatB/YqeY domain-containing protein [Roseiarcus sp.]
MAEAVSLSGSVSAQMKEAMKAGDKTRVGALRLIMSALKDREIEARGAGKIVSRADELALLTKMAKTRQESLTIYKDNGREDLAAQESAEIAIINEFLPKQMDETAVAEAARAAVAETGAAGVRDMGKVIAALKEKYPGQMDFARASAIVKGLLAS